MKSAQKHTFINTKNLQREIFLCSFNCFFAQHSLKRLIFSQVLFCSLFSFSQEENTTIFYINPNTTVVGLNYISSNEKLSLQEESKQATLYIVENTIFNAPQDFTIITITSKSMFCSTTNKKNNDLDWHIAKTKIASVESQSKTQLTQASSPFSLPIEQKQTRITTIATTTITPTTFSKTTNKLFVFDNYFSLRIRKALTKKQNAISYNKNSKTFQLKRKHYNRPPPLTFC